MNSRIRMALTVCLLLTSGTAQAQLVFTLDNAAQSGMPCETLSFSGTLQNSGPSTLFLNGTAFALAPGTGLTLDDTPFYVNAPLFLTSGETWNGPLFDLELGLAAGDHVGLFTLLGGADDMALDDLASQVFRISVVPAAVPEPGVTALLAGLAFPGMRWTLRRLRHHT